MALPLAPGTWTLDHSHTSIEFTARHLGISKVRGRFGGFDAAVVHFGNNAGHDVTSAPRSTWPRSTQQRTEIDAHLRGSDFFSVNVPPEHGLETTSMEDWQRGLPNDGNTFLQRPDEPVDAFSKIIRQ